tara:strand:+ start:416 stop:958 length:543 start_codon:yes stop_codon:yes gene_type:complete
MGGFQGLGDWYHHPEKNKNSMAYEMLRDKRKEYYKEYNEKNKEKIKQQNKDWYINNKEKHNQQSKEWYKINSEKHTQQSKERYQNNKEYIKHQMKEYYKTPECKKSYTISNWKRAGLKLFGYTYDEVYEYYLSIDNCEVCNKDISMGGGQRNMDHCHSTGIFRWVLCSGCNNQDSWMNKI